MLTLLSIPKPFVGRIAEIQQTALASWAQLAPDIQIILVGDESGVANAATAAGLTHVDGIERNEHGTPRVDDAFARVGHLAKHPVWCFVNADVVLVDDFIPAVLASAAIGPRFLMVGQNRNLAVVDPVEVSTRDARSQLRLRALREGAPRGAAALDFFVFPAGHFDPMPPFLVGRACFDNWLLWKGRQRGSVIDATAAVVAVHQHHDYAHLAGGLDEAYYGEEAAWNSELAGGRGHLYTLHDASHRMRADLSIHRNPGSILRARETVRKIGWKLGVR